MFYQSSESNYTQKGGISKVKQVRKGIFEPQAQNYEVIRTLMLSWNFQQVFGKVRFASLFFFSPTTEVFF